MSNELAGLNVTITRPLHQALKLQQEILAKQGHPISFPTLTIESLQPKNLGAIVNTINQYDLLIFTSQNAVNAIVKLLPKNPRGKIAAIGPATAKALLNSRLPVDIVPSQRFESEQLLEEPFLKNITAKNVLILSGEGGRSVLENQLHLRGANVEKLALYRRNCPIVPENKVNAVVRAAPNIIVTTSGEGLRNLVTIFVSHDYQKQLFQMPIVVINDRMMAIALTEGFSKESIVVSENPTEAAILESIIKWYATKKSA